MKEKELSEIKFFPWTFSFARRQRKKRRVCTGRRNISAAGGIRAVCLSLLMMIVWGIPASGADIAIIQEQNISAQNSAGNVQAQGGIKGSQIPAENVSKATKTTKTAVSVRTVKLAEKSKKTCTKKGKVQKTVRTEIKILSGKIVKVRTVTKRRITNEFEKGSKICTQRTITTVVTATKIQTTAKGKDAVIAVAPGIDSRVLTVYTALGFTIGINPDANYNGMFNSETRSIMLKESGDVVYHELGHFVAFVTGNIDRQEDFVQIFEREKDRHKRAYMIQSSSEYFAESFKDYTLDPEGLKASRPLTYAAVRDALDRMTEAQAERVRQVFQVVWKNGGA